MKIVSSPTQDKQEFVATIGFFDGVHIGHQFIIEELKNIAREKKQKSLLITFPVHPRKVLKADFQPRLLTSYSEKIRLLENTAIDACAILDFTTEMSKMSAFDFMKKILKEQFSISTLLIGHDHRFGHNREEDFSDYRRYGETLGIEVIQAKRFTPNFVERVSSSAIREKIKEGDVKMANKMLGYHFSREGLVVGGFKIGRKIGFPTANIQIQDKDLFVPSFAAYAVYVDFDNERQFGMLNIGKRPTLKQGNEISIEVHLFDFNKDIYGKEIKISFLEKLRDEKSFNSIDELIAQLKKDKEQALTIIKKEALS